MATKKLDKPVKKSPQRPTGPEELIIQVPPGGQVIGVYELAPQLPKDGKLSDWELTNTETGNVASDEIGIGFSEKSSSIQCDFERAVLVINMAEDDKKGRWRFALEGIDVCSCTGDETGDLHTEIVNYGKTLLIYAHSPGLGKQYTQFSFVASYTDALSGQTTIYVSKDPGIGVGRPFP